MDKFWDNRYLIQANWTRDTRQYLWEKIALKPGSRILEVGCGSMAVLREYLNKDYQLFGLDIDLNFMKQYQNADPFIHKINGDGNELPFESDRFDLCFCHFFLLWIFDPIKVILEMKRVLKKNGWLCCFAEPDYLARIDYPEKLEKVGQLQNESLKVQGAELSSGRKIPVYLRKVGLNSIHWGIIGAFHNDNVKNETSDELDMIKRDLAIIRREDEIRILEECYKDFFKNFESVLFVPTFFAIGRK